jgi:SAM-dependent methyltransferase
MRGVVHHLSVGLFGSSIALPDFPVSPGVVGLGLSDWTGYATRLEECFDYTNTYYHQEPLLDIAAPPPERLGSADFLISTDVLEHIPPPVALGFRGAFSLLRPAGLLVLTVPFRDIAATIEHFPRLHRFRVVRLSSEDFVLLNRTSDGVLEVHEKLVFHGGPGDTLEMRVFSRLDTEQLLRESGFVDIRVHAAAVPKWGIFPPHLEGLPITARRPG